MPNLKYPYAFVPFDESQPDKASPMGHEDYSGHAGVLECRLTALTPFIVCGEENERSNGNHEDTPYLPIEERRKAIIPGKSLKGMIRSIFEIITNSCKPISEEHYSHGIGKFKMVPDSHKKCENPRNLCEACRVFGFTKRGEKEVHKGHVTIGQATVEGIPSYGEVYQLPAMYGPHVTVEDPKNEDRKLLNKKYYGTPRNPSGRKFYVHHKAYDEGFPHADQKRDYVQPLAEGTQFQFEVSFENMSSFSLDALVASLTLSDDARTGNGKVKTRHKLGYGKPAGLGSVNIEIECAALEPSPDERYRRFDASPDEKTKAELAEWIEEKQVQFFDTSRPSMHALARALRWPPDPDVDVTYDADPPA